eukprot:TRINITY_DN8684_c0_g3_i1.p1 TRINITY_DN8684_c0_g3~~TRINITY_DN8684_c0_g3_i1.p1  ORF type:complete len:289 (+),score=14.00 TRINITY_DN8684_c0_g3_i1:79-867(+)
MLSWSVLLAASLDRVSAGPGYPACFSACMTACMIGTGNTGLYPCTLICSSSCGVACLSDNTTATRLDTSGVPEDVAVQDLRRGDVVLTLVEDRTVPTRVTQNVRSVGDFSFTEIVAEHCENALNLRSCRFKHLTVTSDHNVVLGRFGRGRNPTTDLSDDGWTVAAAKTVRVGDRIPVVTDAAPGASGIMGLVRVSSFRQIRMNARNTVVTESGTILANALFVTTMCDGQLAVVPPTFNATMQKWRSLHAGLDINGLPVTEFV